MFDINLFLKNDSRTGIFSFEGRETKFVWQTEVILTSRVEAGRKSVYTVILFPSFDAVERGCTLLDKWEVKNTTANHPSFLLN